MKKCWKYLALILFLPLLMGGTVQVGTGPTKTTGTISKTIGATGDYATFAAAIAAVPDLLAHNVTLTIKAGTTLSEACTVRNRHAVTDAYLLIRAEKYFPTSGGIPTADSATATTLRDADLASAALGDDYFNSCWVFIVDGTGTDNGYVLITDYIDATGGVVVASWPGTQPDNTSRYLILGALINAAGQTYGLNITNCSCQISIFGIGVKDATTINIRGSMCLYVSVAGCGSYNAGAAGVQSAYNNYMYFGNGGVVKNNTSNSGSYGGLNNNASGELYVNACGISDNNQRGILAIDGGHVYAVNCFGDNNGSWGSYAMYSGQINGYGTECSGSSGDHSNGSGDGSLAY